MQLSQRDIDVLVGIAEEAGRKVNSVYARGSVTVHTKDDNSPLTIADQLSHEFICGRLTEHFPSLPVLSEESAAIDFEERRQWEYFWLIDPLDGTKEFIQRNGEFTINLALIHNNQPVFAAVAIPVRKLLYVGLTGQGAFKREGGGRMNRLVRRLGTKPLTVARSRSHPDPKEDELLVGLGETRTVFAGSSLKFCYVAEGLADVYLRSGPTMEWDTAAGQCIAECAGCSMRSLGGEPFTYNKEQLKNPGFICAASEDIISKILPRIL